jgi:nucleoside-diphosphate-sugar epimerase
MFTIVGASGFIGSSLAASLRATGTEVSTPGRGKTDFLDRELGHVIYCAGVTSDFLSRPLDTVDAHVTALMPLLRNGRFRSLLYLSSTRLYLGAASSNEDAPISIRSDVPNDLYAISKLMGEAACLTSGRHGVRVVRLSNVYGPGMPRINFLADIASEAVECGSVVLRTTLDSAKDYVALEDVLEVLPRIATCGRHRIYNLASGRNVTNGEILDELIRLTGCCVSVASNAAHIVFPPIDVRRIGDEFGTAPTTLKSGLPRLIEDLRQRASTPAGI